MKNKQKSKDRLWGVDLTSRDLSIKHENAY